MNDFAIRFVPLLFQTTLWLTGAALIAMVGLRTSRSNSSLAHRIACVLTLLVGWTFVRFNVNIPWYEPAANVAVDVPRDEMPAAGESAVTDATGGLPAMALADVEPPLLPEREIVPERTPPATIAWDVPAALMQLPPAPEPIVSPAAAASPVADDNATLAEVAPAPLEVPPHNRDVALAPTALSGWLAFYLALIGLWAAGMLLLAGAWLAGYVRFARSVRRQEHNAPHPSWLAQWQALLDAHRIGRAIPLRTTRDLGPLLCRLPSGYELLVPAELWGELNVRERQAILRHELAHLMRGDVWKSLAVRALALPHWFNPLAWWAVRRFDEAAEWAADLMAAGQEDEATAYAKVLVRLGESLPASSAYGSSARGRSLVARVKRLLLEHQAEDTTMKKLLLATAGVCVLMVALIKVQLVAQEPPRVERSEAVGDSAEAAELAKPASEEVPPLVAEVLEAFGQDRVDNQPIVATPTLSVRLPIGGSYYIAQGGPFNIEVTDEKILDANKALEDRQATVTAKAAGTATVKVWKDGQITCTIEFEVPTQFDELASKLREKFPGTDVRPVPAGADSVILSGQVADAGSARDMVTLGEKYFAKVVNNISVTDPPVDKAAASKPTDDSAASANRRMLEAAKDTYDAMMESYQAQTATGEQLFAWSNRWLNAELSVATATAMRSAAYAGHVERMDKLLIHVKELYHRGMKGGDASEYGAAQYFAADAKARLAQWEAQYVAPKAPAAPAKSSERTAPAAPPSERQSQAPAPPQPKPVALTTAERIWDVLGLRLEERPKESFTVGNAAVKEFVGGLVVTEVRSGTPADKAGIRPSNVLVEVSQNEGTGPGRPYKVTTLASLQELADDVLWHENSQLSIATLTKRKSDDEYWVHDWRLFPTVFRLMRTPAGGQEASGYTRSSYAIEAAALLWNKLRIEAESVPQQELRALLGEKAEYRKGLRITKAETFAQAPPWKVGDILVGIDEFEVGSLLDFVQIANRHQDRFDQQPPLSQIWWFSLGNGGKYVMSLWEAGKSAEQAEPAGREPIKATTGAPAAPPSARQSQAPAPPQPKPVALTTAERIWDVLGLRLEERPKESFTVGNAAVKEFVGGLVVTQVRSGTPADAFGIRPGNVLVEVSQNEGTVPGRPYKVTTLASLQELADDVIWQANSQLSIAMLTKRKSDDEYWVKDWRLFPTVFRLMRTPANVGQRASEGTSQPAANDAERLWNLLGVEAEPVTREQLLALAGQSIAFRRGLKVTKIGEHPIAPKLSLGDIIVGIDGFEVGSLKEVSQVLVRQRDSLDHDPPGSKVFWLAKGPGGKYEERLWIRPRQGQAPLRAARDSTDRPAEVAQPGDALPNVAEKTAPKVEEILILAPDEWFPAEVKPVRAAARKLSPDSIARARDAYLEARPTRENRDVDIPKVYHLSQAWMESVIAKAESAQTVASALHDHAQRMLTLEQLRPDLTMNGQAEADRRRRLIDEAHFAESLWATLGLQLLNRPTTDFWTGNDSVIVGGLLVNVVRKGSPADRGGVRPGHIIISLDYSIRPFEPQTPSLLRFKEAATTIAGFTQNQVTASPEKARCDIYVRDGDNYKPFRWMIEPTAIVQVSSPLPPSHVEPPPLLPGAIEGPVPAAPADESATVTLPSSRLVDEADADFADFADFGKMATQTAPSASSLQPKTEAEAKPRPVSRLLTARPAANLGPQPPGTKVDPIPYVRVIYDTPELLLDVDDRLMSRADFFDFVRKNEWVAKKTFRHYQFDWSPDPIYVKQCEDLMKSMRELGVNFAYGWSPSLLVKISLNDGPKIYRQSYALAEAGTLSAMVNRAGGKLTDENLPQTIAYISSTGKPTARILITDYSYLPIGNELNDLEKRDAEALAKSLEELGFRVLIRMADTGRGTDAKPEQPTGNVPAPKADQAHAERPIQATQSATVPLTFGGKTFEAWQYNLRHDLGHQNRVEGLDAMAALGGRDRATEAAKMIFEIMGDYDYGRWQSNDSFTPVIQAADRALETLPREVTKKVVIEALDSPSLNVRTYALSQLDILLPMDGMVEQLPKFMQIAQGAQDPYERSLAVKHIAHLAEKEQPGAMSALQKLMCSDDRAIALVAIRHSPAVLPLIPDVVRFLLGDDAEFSEMAKRNLHAVWGGSRVKAAEAVLQCADKLNPDDAKKAFKILKASEPGTPRSNAVNAK